MGIGGAQIRGREGRREGERGRRKRSVADRPKEGERGGRFDGSAGKSLKRENKRGLDWTAREKERMKGSVAFYGIAAESS